MGVTDLRLAVELRDRADTLHARPELDDDVVAGDAGNGAGHELVACASLFAAGAGEVLGLRLAEGLEIDSIERGLDLAIEEFPPGCRWTCRLLDEDQFER